MTKKRRIFDGPFRAKVALETLKEELTLAELAVKYGVTTKQISDWKKQLIQGAAEIMTDKRKKPDKDLEKEKDELYQKIGRLEMELDWAKKKFGIK
jgi:transposase